MKKIFLQISFIFVFTISLAQNKDTKIADKHFNRFEYVDASKAYLDLVGKGKKDNYIYKQLADCYYNMFNTTEAIKWYALTVTQPQDAETYYRYAQMLKGSGKYDEANKQMATFASKAPNDKRAIAYKENPNYIPKLLDKKKMFDIKNTTINTDKSEFGAFLANDNSVYFSSARNLARRNTGWTEEPYLDIYKTIYNPDTKTMSVPTLVEQLNTKFHEGPVSITADNKTIYFSRDGHSSKEFEMNKTANAKFSQVMLYKATRADASGVWGDVKALPINSKSFSVSNPSISKDGKTLYFNSNMPNGIGNNDIWKVAVNSDGTYGNPENLGANINTEGNEQFPFISDDNKLYYSSSGKPGLGGLDVFVVDLNTPNAVPQNVGQPVNSDKDDFAFTYNTSKNYGFFASNRAGGDDIYSAVAVCGLDVNTTVTDAKTGTILAGASVSIVDDKKNIISNQTADNNGKVNFSVECNKIYSIQASRTGYESGVFDVKATTISGNTEIAAKLNPIEEIIKPTEIVLNEIYFEYDKSNITQEGAFELDKLVQVLNTKPEMIIMAKSHTDNRGSDAYNLKLSERRAQATVQYVISKGIASSRISGKGFGESEPKIDCKENCTDEEHSKNRRSEFLIVK